MTLNLITQVTLASTSGMSEDVIVNSFSWNAPDGQAGNEIESNLSDFYQEIGVWLSPSVDRTVAPHVKTYNAEDATPRVPMFEFDLALMPGPSGAGALPNEVALCLSYHGEYVSGSQNSRRRGRVYIGPFHAAANVVTAGVGRPSTSCAGDILNAGVALLNDADTDASWDMSVYSRADDFMYNITTMWIDNEWDTQRRRGRKATLRAVHNF